MRSRLYSPLRGLASAIGEWAAALEAAPGALEVDPRVAALGTAAAVSSVSFSRTLLPPISGIALSTAAMAVLGLKGGRRILSAGAFWLAFTLAIMAPRVVVEGGGAALEAAAASLRVAAGVLLLMTCVALAGSARILQGMRELGAPSEFCEALTLLIAQISSTLGELSSLVAAKRSRILSRPTLRGEYGLLSLAASELFVRGPSRALNLRAVVRSRIWTGRPRSRGDGWSTAAFILIPAGCLLALLIEVLST
ncbi:MAG TPA: hypothetical protein ENF83_00265 [Candidatus Korarchaeota archaeon]|nr:hypothetical protein [Candidatus Korarchaeota archaeon]